MGLEINKNSDRGSDGVRRQGREDYLGRSTTPGGELVDPNDPESILMAKQEREQRLAEASGLSLREYRERQKNQNQKQKQQRFDKAA